MPEIHEALYVQPGRCLAGCACAGVYEAAECPMEPGCDRCFLQLRVVGPSSASIDQLPGQIMVVRVLPGEPLRRVVERELGPEYASGPGGLVN